MHLGYVQSPFLFAVVVDIVKEFGRDGMLSKLLYSEGLLLMSETNEVHRNKFFKWKVALESKGLKVNLRKTMVMVSGSIAKDGISKSKFDLCGVCSLRVKANSVLCVVWQVEPQKMCKSEKNDSKDYKKYHIQKMLREYLRGSGAGRKVVMKSNL